MSRSSCAQRAAAKAVSERGFTAEGVLGRSLEAEGGSLVVSQGPPEIVGALGAWGESGPVAPFNAGIRAAFDPASILAQGRLPQ